MVPSCLRDLGMAFPSFQGGEPVSLRRIIRRRMREIPLYGWEGGYGEVVRWRAKKPQTA